MKINPWVWVYGGLLEIGKVLPTAVGKPRWLHRIVIKVNGENGMNLFNKKWKNVVAMSLILLSALPCCRPKDVEAEKMKGWINLQKSESIVQIVNLQNIDIKGVIVIEDKSLLQVTLSVGDSMTNIVSYIAVPKVCGNEVEIDLSLVGVIYDDATSFEVGEPLSAIEQVENGQRVHLTLIPNGMVVYRVFLNDGESRKLIWDRK